jgi:endonuclease/exonuclease/phosphatase family metal-dependent hydrolase
MPYYYPLKNFKNKDEQDRTITRLLALRTKIKNEVPQKTARETLLLATWNIREFKDNRLAESLYYISEIIDCFDFVAVQEVSSDLKGLEKLMGFLGKHWAYIVTDSTEGSAGGGERMAFLYDTHKISFRNIAGEVVLPMEKVMSDGTLQFARTPFLAAFQAGWFKFTICTVHIYYGETSINSEGMKRRIAEIEYISKFLQKKSKNDEANYILLGDFNIEGMQHATFKALESGGFFVPNQLRDKPTDLGQVKNYDQIAFQVKEEDMLIFSKAQGHAGVFKFHEVIMTDADLEVYKPYFDPKNVEGKTDKQLQAYYKSKWRTFQISDHLPMWVELHIDFSEEYLNKIMKGGNTNNMRDIELNKRSIMAQIETKDI